MKTLVLGCDGQLGRALANTTPEGVAYVGLDLPDVDITNSNGLMDICREIGPAVIINAAAYTAVDLAETEVELATAVNANGPENIAAAAVDVDARLIHISTDFVFDGDASTPYVVDSATNPLNVYGRTKLAGELAVLNAMPQNAAVLRTAWLYSRSGGNFVKTMLRLMAERESLNVVADQRGTPTWADSLALVVWAFTRASAPNGIFHWTDGGETSWHGFATAIQEEALGLGLLDNAIPIHAINTEDFPTAAKRPSYSVLDCSITHDATGIPPAPWRENLRKMLSGL